MRDETSKSASYQNGASYGDHDGYDGNSHNSQSDDQTDAKRNGLTQSVKDALSNVSLFTLLSGAARLRQSRLAIEQLDQHHPQPSNAQDVAPNAITFAALEAMTQHYALRLNLLGLQPGETILQIGVATCEAIAVMIAALHAGLHVVILPPSSKLQEAAMIASAKQVAAVVGPVGFGALDYRQLLFDIAIECTSVRLIALFGAGKVDGAVSLDAGRNYTANFPALPASTPGKLITILPTTSMNMDEPQFAYHEQTALVKIALQIISAFEMTSSCALVSPLMPCSLAGLLFGPIICLLSGASLYYTQSFFHTATFNTLLPKILSVPEPIQLIVPAKLGAALLREPDLQDINAKNFIFTKTLSDTANAQNDTALFHHLQTICASFSQNFENGTYAPGYASGQISSSIKTSYNPLPTQNTTQSLIQYQSDAEKFTFLRYPLQSFEVPSSTLSRHESGALANGHSSMGQENPKTDGMDNKTKARWRAA